MESIGFSRVLASAPHAAARALVGGGGGRSWLCHNLRRIGCRETIDREIVDKRLNTARRVSFTTEMSRQPQLSVRTLTLRGIKAAHHLITSPASSCILNGAASTPDAGFSIFLRALTCAASVTNESNSSTTAWNVRGRHETHTCTTHWRCCAEPITWNDIHRSLREGVACRAFSS